MMRNVLIFTRLVALLAICAACVLLVAARSPRVVSAQASPAATLPLTQRDLSVLTGVVLRPNGMVWFEHRLYVLCSGDWTLYELDDTSGATSTYLWGVRDAHALYVERDADGALQLWVPDSRGQRLVRVSREGLEEVITDLSAPWGIAPLDETTFLVSDLREGVIEQVGRDGARELLLDSFAAPTGIARDGDALYVANFGSARRGIEWVSLSDLERGAQPLVSGLPNVTGMQLGADGNLYFTYAGGGRGVVGRVNPAQCRENGGCTAEQVELVLTSDLRPPLAGLTLSPEGRLYLHTQYGTEIYWTQIPAFQSQNT